MKTYSILVAEDIPHYGTAEITAADDAEAIARAKALDLDGLCTDPAWDEPVCRRIVHIEAPDGDIVAQDVALDGFFLRHTRNIDPVVCDAAPALKAALTRIAAIPLWGEPITDEQLKADLVYACEYDQELDQFEPSCDTESSYLHDAVTTARAALDEAKVAPATTDDDAPELLEALRDLLGDRPDVQGGVCQTCGRDYIPEILEGPCPADDCPAYKARAAIAKARGLA